MSLATPSTSRLPRFGSYDALPPLDSQDALLGRTFLNKASLREGDFASRENVGGIVEAHATVGEDIRRQTLPAQTEERHHPTKSRYRIPKPTFRPAVLRHAN